MSLACNLKGGFKNVRAAVDAMMKYGQLGEIRKLKAN